MSIHLERNVSSILEKKGVKITDVSHSAGLPLTRPTPLTTCRIRMLFSLFSLLFFEEYPRLSSSGGSNGPFGVLTTMLVMLTVRSE